MIMLFFFLVPLMDRAEGKACFGVEDRVLDRRVYWLRRLTILFLVPLMDGAGGASCFGVKDRAISSGVNLGELSGITLSGSAETLPETLPETLAESLAECLAESLAETLAETFAKLVRKNMVDLKPRSIDLNK